MVVALAWSSLAFCDYIFLAVDAGDLERVKALLKDNPDLVFSKDSDGMTPLLKAAMNGNKDLVELLLDNKADVNAKNDFGLTPLRFAATRGYKDVAELLLAKGADVNAKDGRGETPLHGAAENARNLEIVKLLLANKADVNARDNYNGTPLHTAAYFRSTDIAELLIARGADVNAKDNRGMTPLLRAGELDYPGPGYRDVVELLLAHGADVNAKDDKGRTALYFAVKNGHKDVVELLQHRQGGRDETTAPTNDLVETMIAVLNSDGSRDAAEALGNSHDARAVEPLIAVLKPQSSATRDQLLAPVVAKSLGNLGDPRAVDPLIACLKDRDGRVQVSGQTLALISKAREATDDTRREKLQSEAVQRFLAEIKQKAEAEKDAAEGEMKAANAHDPNWWKYESHVKACLPKTRETNVVYWVQVLVYSGQASFGLKETVPCNSGPGVFLAEVMVPCGAVFVNQENQIGGKYYFIPASEAEEPSNVYWRNATRAAAAEALTKLGPPAVQPLIDCFRKQ
jgi:ankyrin repeat protein